MANGSGKVWGSASATDVKTVLGENTYNVAQLCMSTKIRIWAKYKPEAIGDAGGITLAQRKANNFGLRPYTSWSTFASLVSTVAQYGKNFPYTWFYLRPGSSDPKRLGDFLNSTDRSKVGYNHNARCPFGTLLPFEAILSDNSNQRLIVAADAPGDIPDSSDDDGLLMISDLTNSTYDVANWYFGVLLYYSSSKWIAATNTKPMSSGGDWQVDFGHLAPSQWQGTYTAIPLLSKKTKSASGEDPGGNSIVMIGSPGVTAKLSSISGKVWMTVSCSFVNSYSNEVIYTAQIVNTLTSQIVLNGLGISISTTQSNTGSQSAKVFNSATIPAGGTWTESGRFTVPNRSYKYCNFTTSTSTYGNISTGWMQFEELEQSDNI